MSRMKWTDELIEEGIMEVIDGLMLDRMPTRKEVASFFGNEALTNVISRTIGFIGWASKINLPSVDSETSLGKEFEKHSVRLLEENGFNIERMSTNYHFDLLINGKVKVDVKTSRPRIDDNGFRSHTFGISKRYGSCDIYLVIALDENDMIEKILLIPSVHLQVVTLCIGAKSKYDKYLNRFDIIHEYDKFLSEIN